MQYNKNKPKEYNIPLYKFEEDYKKISNALETKPVVIGGRAVNFLCYKDTRFTHDIDVVINVDPTLHKTELFDSGFSLKWNGPKVVGATYIDSVNLLNGGTPLTIDFYYSKPINGISINEIVSNVKEVNLGKMSVLVPSPAIMLLLKYDAGREKDIRDFRLLLENFYAGSIDGFFDEEHELLDSLLNNHINDGKKMNKLLIGYYYYKENQMKLRRN